MLVCSPPTTKNFIIKNNMKETFRTNERVFYSITKLLSNTELWWEKKEKVTAAKNIKNGIRVKRMTSEWAIYLHCVMRWSGGGGGGGCDGGCGCCGFGGGVCDGGCDGGCGFGGGFGGGCGGGCGDCGDCDGGCVFGGDGDGGSGGFGGGCGFDGGCGGGVGGCSDGGGCGVGRLWW
jgi:hypothetical protein